MIGVLLDETVYHLLGNRDMPDGVFSFRLCYHKIVVLVLCGLFADGDGFLGDIQVFLSKRHQLTFPDSADQLQIEHS